jgi:Protein of unknown function (DUF3618)
MTASGRAAKPASKRVSGGAGATGPGAVGDAAATGETPEDAPRAQTQPAVPDNEQELRAEIEQIREELGETVEQLAAKLDVQGRARAKTAALTGRVKDKAVQARATAAARASEARGQAAGKTHIARQKAAAATGPAKTQVQARAATVRETTPEAVRRAVARGASTAQQRRVPLGVAAITLIAGYLALRRWRKR